MPKKLIKVLFVNNTHYRYATDECINMIKNVSPDVNIIDATDLVLAELADDANAFKQLDRLLADTEIIFGKQYLNNLLLRAPKLRWVQHPFAGVEKFLVKEFVDSSIVLTNTGGMHSQVAELVMTYILMFSKHIPNTFRNQQTGRWIKLKVMPEVLKGKTVGILGLGHIGREVARLSKAFKMRVIGIRSKNIRTKYADQVYPPEQIKNVLSQSDFVVVSLPDIPETNKLIGRGSFQAMKPTAYIINIARGSIIDESALVQALKDKTIAGAALDVATVEPLQAESELWNFPNVIITPHIGGPMPNYMQKATSIFVENLKRYLKGQKLHNVVNKKKGY